MENNSSNISLTTSHRVNSLLSRFGIGGARPEKAKKHEEKNEADNKDKHDLAKGDEEHGDRVERENEKNSREILLVPPSLDILTNGLKKKQGAEKASDTPPALPEKKFIRGKKAAGESEVIKEGFTFDMKNQARARKKNHTVFGHENFSSSTVGGPKIACSASSQNRTSLYEVIYLCNF